MGHPMRLELTRVGLLVKVANHYTTKGALDHDYSSEVDIHWVFLSYGFVPD